jgi:hypothetical protein
MSETIMFEGIILRNVHDWQDCQTEVLDHYHQLLPRACVIHRPTPHHMRLWPLVWRDDRGIFERGCAHGIGHPDPDQFDYWRETATMYRAVHSCDGCCRPPFPGDPEVQARWSTWPTRSTGTAIPVDASDGSTWEAAPTAASPRRVR